MTNGSGIGLGGGGTAVTGRGKVLAIFATCVLTLILAGCEQSKIGYSPEASFEPSVQAPVVVAQGGRVGPAATPIEWATVRLQADWNDLEAAIQVAQTEAETAVVQELTAAVRASRDTGTLVPFLRRTFELLSISGETGLFVAEAERITPPVKSGPTHQMVLRAELHSAVGSDRNRAAKFVEAMAVRMNQLSGVDSAPVP